MAKNPKHCPPSCLRVAYLFIPVICLLLIQCASTDPEFESLVAHADPNPPKDAIVGMWHKRQFTVDWVVSPRCSYLFNRDGTGIYRLTSGSDVLEQDRVEWHYAGTGLWTLRCLDRGDFTPIGTVNCRVTHDHNTLLWTQVGLNWVFERVD